MQTSARVVVIGGGVVGASVLYHLTEAGWTDVMLIERKELTAGSTWHAAGGMHSLNGDPNVAQLQRYTIELYRSIEARSGQSCGIHMTGGLMLASDRDRLDWLRMAQARGRYLGMDLELIGPEAAKELFPLLDEQHFIGALYDPVEGHVDPTGVTNAFASCARDAGAKVERHTFVEALRPRADGSWDVVTDRGAVHAEHVVNAAGLWAREVGRMVGIELPVLAMEHMYLITETMPEVQHHMARTDREMPMALDFSGEIYIRQEGDAMLFGTYEQQHRVWSPISTPWDFDMQLLDADLDRIAPELEVAFAHYPALAHTGIRRVVNGPFTFSPDGNPLVGPVPGLRNCWVACGVMAGLSQGGGVGLALANWITTDDPGFDIWAMDVARYGTYADADYTRAKVCENYGRRFAITFPNEELAAARPTLTTPIHARLTAQNAVWGAAFGLEHALWFQRAGQPPIEDVTFRRSNAFNVVAEECRAVRERVGLIEISNFAKYRVRGAHARRRLEYLLTKRPPPPGRLALTAALDQRAHIVGEFTVATIAADEWLLFGSHAAETHHARWFETHGLTVDVVGLDLVGLSVAGPLSRALLQSLTDTSLATADFGFMSFREVSVAGTRAQVGRLSYTGDLGYEIWVEPSDQVALFDALVAAGEPLGLACFGARALMSLRIEKRFGTWAREYRPIYSALEAGLDRYITLDHDFIGRAALESERADGGPKRTLGYFEVEVDLDDPADVIGDEPIFHDGVVVGWVTSGGYAHHSKRSLALGYVPTPLARVAGTEFEIEIVGQRRPARLLDGPVFDPTGSRMRA
jgi:dimethylglycine dehydrogenase